MSHTNKLLQTAIAHHQAGRFKDAEKAYHKLLHVEAAHGDGLRLLGALYLQEQNYGLAVENLDKAARLLPNDPETLTNLGIALRKQGRTQEAMARYQQALDLQPLYLLALNNMGSLHLDAGHMTEALEFYGRALKAYPQDPTTHYHYGNSLLIAGRVSDAVVRYEHALKLKPDYLEAMINLGMALSQLGKADQSRQWLGLAKSWFEKALKADPLNVVAMNNIGNVLRQQGKPEQAIPYYQEALRLRPDYGQAALNMATSLRDINKFDEAIDVARTSLRLMPNSAEARINLGSFLQDLARHQEALTFFDEALAIKSTSIDAKWNKSLSLLALGRYDEGWPLHETGLGVAHMRGEYPSPERRWNGENFRGKRLLIWSEQGFGDSLQFVRYAALCKQRGGDVIMLCPRPLRGLFRHCSSIDELPESVEEKDFDHHIPLMSLPFVFGTRVETIPSQFPYLFIGEDTHNRWASKITSPHLKVGLVWAGNPRENQLYANVIDRRRSMNLETLRPLFECEGVQFYNLQMGAHASQIDTCRLRDQIIDLMPEVKDFEDTGAIIQQLDLVISVDTSVVHLAGGLGKPVWVMSRFDACWRWLLNRPDSPWYPTARIFGQKAPGEWSDVVRHVKEALTRVALN